MKKYSKNKADYTKLFILTLKKTNNNASIIVISRYYCKYRSLKRSNNAIIEKIFQIRITNSK